MSEALERAIEAIGAIEWEASPETYRTLGRPQREHCEQLTRAALLAFLDPEDEEMRTWIAETIAATEGGLPTDHATPASNVIHALRTLLAGEEGSGGSENE